MATVDRKSALILVDVQNDFCPGGALAVPEGDAVVPVLNEYVSLFEGAGGPVYATRDWHPQDHVSFQAQGGIWPVHCVSQTQGAAFHEGLKMTPATTVISKATTAQAEAYSGFQGTDLADRLRAQGVQRVYVGGLATDYCVKATVLDALQAGFETYYLQDASRGVDVNPGDSQRAEQAMMAAGATAVTLSEVEAAQTARR